MANVDKGKEIWVKIPGEWAHEYEVSNLGRIRYFFISKQKRPYWVAPSKYKYLNQYHVNRGSGNGYLAVRLLIGKKITKGNYVHRLLAVAFIPNPKNKPQVNHIDGNSLNNDLSNLEWATASENSNHAWDIGLCNPSHRRTTPRIINDIKEGISSGKKRKSIAQDMGLPYGSVNRIINKYILSH